ncbi:hypothetical protein [Phaeobacter piscinae]|uniref:hypothetical protein n=1 Tax=Phaeobacter piscinae TaxID=1580596 RepID=UPI000BBEC6E7|nr:hypothetical protein [Phaeobacter piscinae]ATG40036.1 hypothetical protein PhaeoP14_01945 [Phaeobacter piscinae]
MKKSTLLRASECLPEFDGKPFDTPAIELKIVRKISQYKKQGPKICWDYRGFEKLLIQGYQVKSSEKVLEAIAGSRYQDEVAAKTPIAKSVFKYLPVEEWSPIELTAPSKELSPGIEYRPPYDFALKQGNRIACVLYSPYARIALKKAQRDPLLQLLSKPIAGYHEEFELHYFEFPKIKSTRTQFYESKGFSYSNTEAFERHLAKFQRKNEAEDPGLFDSQ